MAVIIVFSTTRFLSATYHTVADTITSTSKLSNIDPEMIQTPVKKSAAIENIMFPETLSEVNELRTARTSKAVRITIWTTTPEFEGILRVLTKKRSNLDDIVTTPGIIPYIRSASKAMLMAKDIPRPFQEKSYFLK